MINKLFVKVSNNPKKIILRFDTKNINLDDCLFEVENYEDNQFKISGPMGPVTLVIDYDSTDPTTTDAKDATIEAGVTYAVPGTTGTTISASYSNDVDEDNFDMGTQVKMAFKF